MNLNRFGAKLVGVIVLVIADCSEFYFDLSDIEL